jgi:hypothetical protein
MLTRHGLRRAFNHPITAGGPVTIILDTFTGADSTALSVHTPDIDTPASAWVVVSGAWQLIGNKAAPSVSIALPLSVIDSLKADCNIEVDVTLIATSAKTGIVGRYTDAGNHWELTLSVTTQLFELIERNATVNTVRASQAVTIAAAETHTLKLVLSGTNLTGYMDGANMITYSSALFQSNTIHGIRGTNTQTTERHDNFKIYTP